MHQQHEEEVKRRLYKTILATIAILGGIFILLNFFSPAVGFVFGLISKVGKPTVKDDTLAPPPPYFYNAPPSTNEKEISLKGFSEPGSKVTVYVNGPEAGSTNADDSGSFLFSNIALIEGKNTIFAKAEDSYNNQSPNSQTLEVSYDTSKPKITITEPKDGAVIRNLNQRVLVKGVLDKKCEVRINEKLAIVKPDNSFELLLGVTEGSVEIKIEATDGAGNRSDEAIKIRYVRAGI